MKTVLFAAFAVFFLEEETAAFDRSLKSVSWIGNSHTMDSKSLDSIAGGQSWNGGGPLRKLYGDDGANSDSVDSGSNSFRDDDDDDGKDRSDSVDSDSNANEENRGDVDVEGGSNDSDSDGDSLDGDGDNISFDSDSVDGEGAADSESDSAEGNGDGKSDRDGESDSDDGDSNTLDGSNDVSRTSDSDYGTASTEISCAADIVLVDTEGNTAFDQVPIAIVEQDDYSAILKVRAPFNDGVQRLYMEYEEDINRKCIATESVTSEYNEEIRVTCPTSRHVTWVSIVASDSSLDQELDDAETTKCCHSDDDTNPKVKYVFRVSCSPQCSETANRFLRRTKN